MSAMTETELRDRIIEAWEAGWRARRHLIGRPAGTIYAEKPKRLDAFLAAKDYKPRDKVTPTPIGEAIQRLASPLVDQVAKLLGKPPYDGPTNIVRNDGYFYRSLVSEYGEQAVRDEIARQEQR